MLLRNGSFGEPELTPQKGAIGMFSRNPMNGPDPLRERTDRVSCRVTRKYFIWPKPSFTSKRTKAGVGSTHEALRTRDAMECEA
jgi:hypothetical protein